MTIFQLECFYTLAKSLNFTQAAQQQAMSQPALSRQISSLEREIGVKLVNRTTRSVSLTPAGSIFLPECVRILRTFREGMNKAVEKGKSTVGVIRLGVPIYSFEPLVVRLYKAMKEKYPGIHLELKFNTPTDLIKSLEQGSVDAIIASGKTDSANARYLMLERRRNCAVLPQDHRFAGKTEIDFSELRGESFISIARSSSAVGYEYTFSFGVEAGFSPKIIYEAETVSSLLTCVACGLGISVLYEDHKRQADNSVVFIPIKNGKLFNRYLIWKDESNPFLDQLVSVAEQEIVLKTHVLI